MDEKKNDALSDCMVYLHDICCTGTVLVAICICLELSHIVILRYWIVRQSLNEIFRKEGLLGDPFITPMVKGSLRETSTHVCVKEE